MVADVVFWRLFCFVYSTGTRFYGATECIPIAGRPSGTRCKGFHPCYTRCPSMQRWPKDWPRRMAYVIDWIRCATIDALSGSAVAHQAWYPTLMPPMIFPAAPRSANAVLFFRKKQLSHPKSAAQLRPLGSMSKSERDSSHPTVKPSYDHLMSYRIGRGEQGVLTFEPYKSSLLPLWRFRTPEVARKSSKDLWARFEQYDREDDFVGMDMCRKSIQMVCCLQLSISWRDGRWQQKVDGSI